MDTPLGLAPIEGGFRVGENETHYVDVMLMLFSWRICETPKSCPERIDRSWCYNGTGRTSFYMAVGAAMLWLKERTNEPKYWNKNVVTGEWRENG